MSKKKLIDINDVDPQVIADYKEVFSTFDRDGDGTIDASELGAVMASFGVNPSQAELAKMIEDVDLDNSGDIDFAEFVTMMQGRSNTSNPEDEAESVFFVLDKDKDGVISFADLSAAMVNIGWNNEPRPNEADIRNMLKVRGSSGNGIDLATFKKIVLTGSK
jgi:calmodulin